MNKRKYYTNNDPEQFRYFNYQTWSSMTPAEQLAWQPSEADSFWPDEKRFTLYRVPETFRYFSEKIWNITPKYEQNNWKPDDSEWPEVEDISKEERKEAKEAARKQHHKDSGKRQIDNLRIKPGAKFNLVGAKVVILKWGPRCHLVEMEHTSGKSGWGLLQRTVRDTSYGAADTMSDRQPYTSYSTLEGAESAYLSQNS